MTTEPTAQELRASVERAERILAARKQCSVCDGYGVKESHEREPRQCGGCDGTGEAPVYGKNVQLLALDFLALLPTAPQPDAGWRPASEAPGTDGEKTYIVAVKRVGRDKAFSFPAIYLYNKELWFEDEEDHAVTGWFSFFGPEDEEKYYPLLSNGDELIAWTDVPQYEESPRLIAIARAAGGGDLEAENLRLSGALKRVHDVLLVPAAEYVPAITDAWKIIDEALGE